MRNILNDTESRSVDMQNLLNKHPHWFILKGNFLISIALLLILLIVGYVVKYPEFVSSKIVITPHSSKNAFVIGQLSASKNNIQKVKIGQKIIVKLNSFPSEEFGTLEGEIKKISMDSINYHIDINFPNGLKTSFNKNIPSTKILKGNAEIIIQDYRLIEKLYAQFSYH